MISNYNFKNIQQVTNYQKLYFIDNLNLHQANNKTEPMRIQKELIRILARRGVTVANKQILAGK